MDIVGWSLYCTGKPVENSKKKKNSKVTNISVEIVQILLGFFLKSLVSFQSLKEHPALEIYCLTCVIVFHVMVWSHDNITALHVTAAIDMLHDTNSRPVGFFF